jgi:hypothetical protein
MIAHALEDTFLQELWPRMQKFLKRGIQDRTGLAQSVAALAAVSREPNETAADTKVTQ